MKGAEEGVPYVALIPAFSVSQVKEREYPVLQEIDPVAGRSPISAV